MATKPPSCEGCPLHSAPGPVWGTGNPSAKLIYIGNAPTTECIRQGRPMSGGVGAILKTQLSEAGVRLDEVYITYQVKCLPPTGGEIPKGAIDKCKGFVTQELERCASDVVILGGDTAFTANVGHYSSLSPSYKPTTSIFERMGCVEQRAGRKWIGTLHPYQFAGMPDFRELGAVHIRKAASLVKFDLKKPIIHERVTDQQVLEFVDKTILGSREFADDVETVGIGDVEEDDYVGGDWLCTMLGVSNSPWEALVLETSQIHLLAPIFQDPGIWRYEQNGEYDQYYLERYLDVEKMVNKRHDTMQAAHWLRSHMPKKLKPAILSLYTWLPYYNRDLGNVNDRLYNGMDLVTTFQAAKEQRRQLAADSALQEVFYKLGQPIPPILEEWRRVGLRIDLRRALLFKRIIQEKIAQAQGLIAKICGPLYNPGSWQQERKMLYEVWKLPVQYKVVRRKKQITSDFEARKKIRWWLEGRDLTSGLIRREMPAYKPAFLYLNLADFLNGEEKKLEYLNRISPDGRIHPYYKGHGQRVFRLGSSPSVVNIPVYDISAWGGARRDDNATATNPLAEEIEEDLDKDEERSRGDVGVQKLGSLRSLILPDHPDDWILTCDFEQMQLWILAAQFKVKWLLDIFESGDYFYGIVYEKLYKEPFFQEGMPRTKKFKLPISEQRIRRAKAVPLGFVFNRTGKAVAEEYGWPISEGNAYREWFMGECHELGPAYAKVEYAVKQTFKYRHIFGQVMHFPTAAVPAAINSLAQSNEAMIVRESILLINEQYVKRGWKPLHLPPGPNYPRMTRLMLSVHDSLSTNVNGERGPQHLVEVYEEVVKPILERPIPQLGGFRFRHSAEVSKMWDWDVINYNDWKKKYITGGT